jgi:hypothetical protein
LSVALVIEEQGYVTFPPALYQFGRGRGRGRGRMFVNVKAQRCPKVEGGKRGERRGEYMSDLSEVVLVVRSYGSLLLLAQLLQ